MLLIRKLHKWFGLILGLQFLLWAASGTVMALLDDGKVSAQHAVLAEAQVPSPEAPLSLAGVATAVGEPVLRLRLRPLFDTYVYEVTTPVGVRLVDAVDGRPVVIDAARAKALAVSRYSGFEPVRSVERVAATTLETRDMPLPAWRVEFADPDHTAMFVSAANGEILGAKNDTWRLWDLAWMFHIMDYTERQSFNHPLIVMVACGVAWLALSGLILLVRSFRRA